MEPISSEIVERTWKKIGKMSPLEIPKMAYLSLLIFWLQVMIS